MGTLWAWFSAVLLQSDTSTLPWWHHLDYFWFIVFEKNWVLYNNAKTQSKNSAFKLHFHITWYFEDLMLKALECTKRIFFISYIIQLPKRNGKQLLSLSMLCAGWIVGFSVHQLSINRSPLKLRSISASKTSCWTHVQGKANDPCGGQGQIVLSVTLILSNSAEDKLSKASHALWEQIGFISASANKIPFPFLLHWPTSNNPNSPANTLTMVRTPVSS